MSEPKKTFKRDALAEIEDFIRSKWDSEKSFEENAPLNEEERALKKKYMITFPFPYMNGRLHLGHSFSLSKAEFAAGYQRLLGKKVLFPFGFHCTGMPIKACADKLVHEMKMYGNPPNFDLGTTMEDSLTELSICSDTTTVKAPKHSKVAAKTGSETSQWKIMASLGIPPEDIPKFAHTDSWLSYFPPKAIDDLKRFGTKVDWRRSFISTDVNPFFDSFIRWQFNSLKAQDKIRFGKRHTIFSAKDGQPCMDHDRASGEGVEPQESTGMKLQLLSEKALPFSYHSEVKPWPCCIAAYKDHPTFSVYLLAATLRPETFYGMTNAWVGPDVSYGAFQISETEIFICTERAAKNLSFQGYSLEHGKMVCLGSIKGKELIGLAISAPLSSYEFVFVCPLMNVLATKGTGIVASVPSDSPDDFAALRDLREKPAFRQKFGLSDSMVLPFEQKPVVQTEGYATPFLAEILCNTFNVKSQNDHDGLAKAKTAAYKEGFYSGTMIVGPYAGKSVPEAKPLIRESLIKEQQAIPYSEPENLVMSRSGDECVVALVDQWYIVYGEPEWKAATKKLVDQMILYHPEVRHQMNNIMEWLGQWACSRSFGLGSRMPWDPQYLIESLSDSTIYMAYYTVAHFLHEGSLDGSTRPCGIQPDQMTDEVWSYIFSPDVRTPPSRTTIPLDLLGRMKAEFEYFYPMDLRVSGKDLLFNHLTMMLYNHVVFFPLDFCPRSMRVNGHLLLNSAKMSKSTGNFMTMSDAITQYTADAMRIALADAGDTLDDANFLEDTSNNAVLKLYTQLEFIQSVKANASSYREYNDSIDPLSESQVLESSLSFFHDQVFSSQMNKLIQETQHAYEQMNYRDVLKLAFYELNNARDRYRDVCEIQTHQKMHYGLLLQFIYVQTLMMAPITPHFCEYVWCILLKRPMSIMKSSWPRAGQIDMSILAADDYLTKVSHSLRTAHQTSLATIQKKMAKKSNISTTTTASSSSIISVPNRVELYVAQCYPPWQQKIASLLNDAYNQDTNTFSFDDAQCIAELGKHFDMKKDSKKIMPFLMELKNKVLAQGPSVFARELPFDEKAVLVDHLEILQKSVDQLHLTIVDSRDLVADPHKAESALPGEPVPYFYYKA